MTWEQKFAAVCALAEASLKMRKPGDWYVSQGVSVKEYEDSSVLVHRYGNGATPQDAIEDHFDTLTKQSPLAYVVIDGYGAPRRHVTWNGFMWIDVPGSTPAAVGAAARVGGEER